ncbi:MAG: cytochrome-c oxidase [Bryobacteraceae bacterium]
MLGVRLTQISAVYMVVGLGLGLGMGISGDFSMSSVHAHILLLGWTTMAICGIVYLVAPGCARSRLAALHFWGHNLGLPVMMASLALKTYGYESAQPAIAASSTLVLVSLAVFAANLLRNAGAYLPAPTTANPPSTRRAVSP